MEFKCSVCTAHLLSQPDAHPDSTDYSCPNCGRFRLTGTALIIVAHETERNLEARAILNHTIRKMQGQDRRPELHSMMVKNILKNNRLPTPAEQADNLIILFGENLVGPGEPMELEPQNIKAVVGAKTSAGVSFIIKSLYEENMLEDVDVKSAAGSTHLLFATLTFAGWQYYEELKKGLSDSRKAFMAMEYGDPDLDTIVDDHFRPAVGLAGFELIRLDDPGKQKAGLIDDNLRVEIRTSRFLIADLTHDNEGAYWEAGFAEGLGKPVIYTCEKEKFKEMKTHFDTNHHLTVIWDKDDPSRAAEELKATIRATLPDEAKLEDDQEET